MVILILSHTSRKKLAGSASEVSRGRVVVVVGGKGASVVPVAMSCARNEARGAVGAGRPVLVKLSRADGGTCRAAAIEGNDKGEASS